MKRSARRVFARGLATVALVALYGLGMIGVSSIASAPDAQARGRGGRGGGFRGRGFRGRGIFLGAPLAYYGYSAYDDRCFWSPRRARWICPSYYRPYRYYYW